MYIILVDGYLFIWQSSSWSRQIYVSPLTSLPWVFYVCVAINILESTFTEAIPCLLSLLSNSSPGHVQPMPRARAGRGCVILPRLCGKSGNLGVLLMLCFQRLKSWCTKNPPHIQCLQLPGPNYRSVHNQGSCINEPVGAT